MPIWFRREKREEIIQQCVHILMATDFLSTAGALIAAHFVRFNFVPAAIGEPSPFREALMVIMASLLFVIIIHLFDGYSRHMLLRFRRSFPVICKACATWLLTFSALALFLETLPWISRISIILGVFFMLGLDSLGRFIILRILLMRGITEAFRQRILFVDWTPQVARLTAEIKKDPWHPYEIAGIAPPQGDKFSSEPNTDLPVLGSSREIERLYKRGLVNITILADGGQSDEEVSALAALCEKHLVTFMMIPSGFDILISGLKITSISSVPVLGVTELPLERPINILIKRLMDIVGGILGMVVFSPVIAIFCCFVYWESPGPVFYRQMRVGRNGKNFKIIKIRSMKLDAEKETGARWASKNDERRLKIGAFMRSWNIDELPQFWNVLMGDMSLVGPRPERPELIDDFKESIKHYNARHGVIPGITGWAQVNGFRGDTDLSERIRYDLYYMENWSPALDLQIMFMTLYTRENAG